MLAYYGATYAADPGPDFGKITAVFAVDANWTGHKQYGYCRAPAGARPGQPETWYWGPVKSLPARSIN
jgi:hypothetical protein